MKKEEISKKQTYTKRKKKIKGNFKSDKRLRTHY